MGKTRREWLKDTLRAGAILAAAPGAMVAAESTAERNLALNRAAYASSAADFINTGHMATDGYADTEWLSKAGDDQWIYVDLGAPCKVFKVVLRWGANPASAYKLQVSNVSAPSPATGFVETWTDVHSTVSGHGSVEEIPVAAPQARYVRVLCGKPASSGEYSLIAFEVYGTGGPTYHPAAMPAPRPDGTRELAGGWKLISKKRVGDGAAQISSSGYDDRGWLPATVPGTVLTSYLNLGAIPDPFYSDHQYQVSDWFAHSEWWYRNEFSLPASYAGKRAWLNLDGINHTADIYVNGNYVGNMAGAFTRGRFDITGMVKPGAKNCVAVLIRPVPKPDKVIARTIKDYEWPVEYTRNAPTFLDSAGWDWLPTIRDRNMGIWNDVSVTASGDVTLGDPFVITDLPLLPDVSQADLTLKVELKNHVQQHRAGTLKVQIGSINFSHPFALEAGETKRLTLDKSAHAELAVHNPRLWWPNGYGEPYLYDFTLQADLESGAASDVKKSKLGIRKFTYNQPSLTHWDSDSLKNMITKEEVTNNPHPLTISCNGQRIMLKGANWGRGEGLTRCDREGYETRLRMEADMNFNIIRSWLGNISKKEFYETCDHLGLIVWEEFGINGDTMPDNVAMWMANARDRLLARRNHACIAVWCTSNEGFSSDPIRADMPKLVDALDGTRLFLQGSTQLPPIDGDGWYETHPPFDYFTQLAHGFRTEFGSPTVPAVETMKRMMPHNQLWPIGDMWGTHDWWTGTGWSTGDGLCGHTEKAVAAYGAATGIEDFCRKAQMVNMEVFKAVYEAWNDKMWDNCTGLMIWMSNPAWPSLTWNTYDYYMDKTAAYFALKKACEPVHIQWSMASNNVKVVNATLKELKGLRVDARVHNLDGSLILKKSEPADCAANSTALCFNLFEKAGEQSPGLSNVHFIKLELKDAEGRLLSDNFYWRAKSVWKYEDLAGMEKVTLARTVKSAQQGDEFKITVNARNESKGVALMTRLKVVDAASGLLVAPVMYSDNYFSLLPGEAREITLSFSARKVTGNEVALAMEGWNVPPAEVGRFHVTKRVA